MGRKSLGLEQFKLTFQAIPVVNAPFEEWCYELIDCLKKGKLPLLDITNDEGGTRYISIPDYSIYGDFEGISLVCGGIVPGNSGYVIIISLELTPKTYSIAFTEV